MTKTTSYKIGEWFFVLKFAYQDILDDKRFKLAAFFLELGQLHYAFSNWFHKILVTNIFIGVK
jgi:hypothetical protein